eukprot:663604-Hanusia_phi.AAC.1
MLRASSCNFMVGPCLPPLVSSSLAHLSLVTLLPPILFCTHLLPPRSYPSILDSLSSQFSTWLSCVLLLHVPRMPPFPCLLLSETSSGSATALPPMPAASVAYDESQMAAKSKR